MKKIIIAIVAVFAMSTAANAQLQDLGIRGAFGGGAGAELSAMWGMGGNRLETDLGWANWYDATYLNLTGIWQWTWDLGSGFGWFAGVGANVGLYSGTADHDGLGLGIAAQIGLEFNPDAIPFQFTLDFRPQWDLLGAHSGFGYAGALGIRYRF